MKMQLCPFCGSEAKITKRPKGFRVECIARWSKCNMNMRTHHFESEEEARSAWNKRTSITLCSSEEPWG